MERNKAIRSIQGMSHHQGWSRDVLIDVASTIVDHDLNDPLESIADLSTRDLGEVRQAILNWRRINTVLEMNGILDEQAIDRILEMSSATIEEGAEVARRVEELDIQTAAQRLIDGLSHKTAVMHVEGSSGRWPDERIIRTGILGLDMATGIGGIPRGRVVEIYGAESSGKSSTMTIIGGQAQKQGMLVLYIDSEGSLVPEWCSMLGMDMETALINYPSSLQEAITTMIEAMKMCSEAGMPDLLIIVDSVPALPAQEMDNVDAREKEFRALNARHWSQWMPMILRHARDSNTTIMLVNQTRQAQDNYTRTSDTTPGGRAIKFAASMRFEVKRQSDDRKSIEGQTGQTTTVDIVKNKVGSPFKKAEFFLYTNAEATGGFVGVDSSESIWSYAVRSGVVSENVKYEDGEAVPKNGWYSLRLREGWLDAIRQDEWDIQSVDPDTGEINPEFSEEQFESAYDDDAWVIQAYREAKARDLFTSYPRLMALIEEAILDTLGGVSESVNYVDNSIDIPDDAGADEETYENQEDSE